METKVHNISVIIILIVFLLMPGCKEPVPEKVVTIKIAASIYPIYDISRNIAGNKCEIIYIIPENANPHTYEPLPSTIKKLQEAVLYVGVTEEMDGHLSKYLTQNTLVRYIIRTGDKRKNPHVWLSVLGAKDIAIKITRYISEADPVNSEQYQKNLQVYIEKLDRLDKRIASLFSGVKRRNFMQWHPAWDYLAADYGLKITATVFTGHGTTPSIKAIKSIITRSRIRGVRVLVVGLKIENAMADMISKEIGGTLVRLDSIGDHSIKERSTFLDLMFYNARILADSLNR